MNLICNCKKTIFLSSLLLICIGFKANAQCEANFDFNDQGLQYFFEDLSSVDDQDSIISWAWDFGDGSTDTLQDVSHNYTFPDIYQVTLNIETLSGCTDTKSREIRNCNLDIQIQLGSICEDGSQELIVQIADLYNVTDTVNVLLDGTATNIGGYAIGGMLNLNLFIAGDDNIHTLQVTSPYSEECTDQVFIFTDECPEICSYDDLTVRGHSNLEVDVLEMSFLPANRIVSLGDTVTFRFLSAGNTTTSDTTQGPDSWASGLRFIGDTYRVLPKTEGIKPYYSESNGGPGGEGMSGNLIVLCASDMKKDVEISFSHEGNIGSGFRVLVDGVALNEVFPYGTAGTSLATIELVQDGNNHNIAVRDIDDHSCIASTEVTTVDCGAQQECNIEAVAFVDQNCDQGSTNILIEAQTIAISENGLGITVDGVNTIDTIFPDSTGFATTTISIVGDGGQHSIIVRDLTNPSCQEVILVEAINCNDCNLSNIQVSTLRTQDLGFDISDFGFVSDDILVPFGEGLLFSWETSRAYGIRGTSNDESWDSGIRSLGSIWITPTLVADSTQFEVYDADENVISAGTLIAVKSCDDGQIPVFLRFSDSGGSKEFIVNIDGSPVDGSPFAALADGSNYVAFQMQGDDMTHDLEIIDVDDESCTVEGQVFAPICIDFDCSISATVEVVLDSCFNDNTRILTLSIENNAPLPRGFNILKDGQQLGDGEISYDNDLTTEVNDTILADGSSYTYIITDNLREDCSDTVTYVTDTCVTECFLSNLNIILVDEDYAESNPSTPELFVGCQADSTHYVAITFDEKYSDADSYAIIIDGESYATVLYEAGDGQNLAFVPIFADSLIHSVRIVDLEDSECILSGEFRTPKCFVECVIFVDKESQAISDCIDGKFTMSFILNDTIEPADLLVSIDGDLADLEISFDTLTINLDGIGLSQTIYFQETDNLLCLDSITYTAPYCLECDLLTTLSPLDSCATADTLRYNLDITGSSVDSLNLTVGNTTQTIYANEFNIIKLIANGDTYDLELTSFEDEFCTETIIVETDDCTPVLCDVDFESEQTGLTVVFTDNSVTTEEINDHSWSITGGITVTGVETFTFNFDSVGVYNICHSIITDSCSNIICKDIEVNPCLQLDVNFSIVNNDGVYQFTNTSGSEDLASFTYDFGDGTISNEEDPMHTYDNNGIYNVCLTVVPADFDCSITVCQEVDFVSSITDPVSDVEMKVYPNPLSSENKIIVESNIAIDGYAIYSTDGRLIQAADIYQGVDKLSINLQEKTHDGLLVLHLKTSKGTFVRKIVSRM